MALLHWGDLKPDKGSQESLSLLRALLQRPFDKRPPLRWLFHFHSQQSLTPDDQYLLHRASEELGSDFVLLNQQVHSIEMQQWLSQCSLALLAYSSTAYVERSSGVLWCYAAARHALGLPACAVGYGQHWLQREAREIGMGWSVVSLVPAPNNGELWLSAIERSSVNRSDDVWLPAADQLLGSSFSDWVLEQIG